MSATATPVRAKTSTARKVLRTGPILVLTDTYFTGYKPLEVVFDDGRANWNPCLTGIVNVLGPIPEWARKVRIEGVVGGAKPAGQGWRKVEVEIDREAGARPDISVGGQLLPYDMERVFNTWNLQNGDRVWVRWTTETRIRGH